MLEPMQGPVIYSALVVSQSRATWSKDFGPSSGHIDFVAKDSTS